MNHRYALIMAGGEGVRFAPLSTPERPKQFLHLVGEGTLLQQAQRRAARIVPAARTAIATSERYVSLVREQLPDIPITNIIAEPAKKNTAPCLAYFARWLRERDPEAVVVIFPADHVIENEAEVTKALELGISVARQAERLVIFGVPPTFPSTAYGYLHCSTSPLTEWPTVFSVDAFVEKPDTLTARHYLSAGGYSWNSGMFVWTVKRFLLELAEHHPSLSSLLSDYNESEIYRRSFFDEAVSISIDRAVLERSRRVVMIPLTAGWSDVGSWEGLYRLCQRGGVSVAPEAMAFMRQHLNRSSPPTHIEQSELPSHIAKPWGHEEIWAWSKQYMGKVLVINRSHRLSYHYHAIKDETLMVLTGAIDFEYEEGGNRKVVRMLPGSTVHIPPQRRHRITAIEESRVLEVSTPHPEDVVRIEDDYDRALPAHNAQRV